MIHMKKKMMVTCFWKMSSSYKRIEDQIISKEPNKLFMKDLFIIHFEESITYEEEHVEIEKLIMESIKLVVFKEDRISMQIFNFVDFMIKADE